MPVYLFFFFSGIKCGRRWRWILEGLNSLQQPQIQNKTSAYVQSLGVCMWCYSMVSLLSPCLVFFFSSPALEKMVFLSSRH